MPTDEQNERLEITEAAFDAMRAERDRFAFEKAELNATISNLKETVRGEQAAKEQALKELVVTRSAWKSTMVTKDALALIAEASPADFELVAGYATRAEAAETELKMVRGALGNLVARLDRDGGHRQDMDPDLTSSVLRADAEIVRLMALEREYGTKEGVLKIFRVYLGTLTDSQREEFFYESERGFCTSCGRKLGVDEDCECSNDE